MADLLHSKLQLDVVTTTERLFSVACDEVRAPGSDGGFGIRPGHTPLISGLGAGVLTYVAEGVEHSYALAGGFLEVAENRVTVLADFAEHASSIDPVQAQRDLEAAQERLKAALDKDLHLRRREEAAVSNAAARIAASKHR